MREEVTIPSGKEGGGGNCGAKRERIYQTEKNPLQRGENGGIGGHEKTFLQEGLSSGNYKRRNQEKRET